MNKRLVLVVPCYNEEKRLDLGEFRAFLAVTPTASIVFVDDGSTDQTRTLLRDFAQEIGDAVRTVERTPNAGKAEAVRVGMLHGLEMEADYVGFWDADLATPLDAVPDFIGVLSRRPDIDWVIGARAQLLGRDIRRRAIRHYLGRVFATAASLVLRMPVYDTQCGAKIFRSSAELKELLDQPFTSKWIFDVEMISRLQRRRAQLNGTPAAESIFELPLRRWVDVAGSKVRGRDFLRASMELFRIWRETSRALSP